MRVLVFGGLGFMGANFVNWTQRNRPEVEIRIADAYTYAADERRLHSPESIQIRRANLLEPSEYVDLIEWCDLTVNFAAETHNDNSLKRPIDFYESNVLGLIKLMQECVAQDRPLVQISTDEVYGDFPLDSDELATEDYPFRPSSPYSASKAAGDLAVAAWIRSFGLKAIVTHCTNNFGPGQHPEKLIPNIIHRVQIGEPIQLYGTGENVRDWIHVDDHSNAVWKVIDLKSWGEVFNISAYNFRSNKHLCLEIFSGMGCPEHPIEFVADRPGHDLRYGLDSSKLRSVGWTPKDTSRLGIISLL
jgi:dTDP-glucose 4,6-dehydratase